MFNCPPHEFGRWKLLGPDPKLPGMLWYYSICKKCGQFFFKKGITGKIKDVVEFAESSGIIKLGRRKR